MTGRCPECGHTYLLTHTGRIPAHVRRAARCPGTLEHPAEGPMQPEPVHLDDYDGLTDDERLTACLEDLRRHLPG